MAWVGWSPGQKRRPGRAGRSDQFAEGATSTKTTARARMPLITRYVNTDHGSSRQGPASGALKNGEPSRLHGYVRAAHVSDPVLFRNLSS